MPLKELPIAAHHPAQLYLSGSLALLALGALAVSYPAIATLIRNRGSALATVATLIGGIGAFRLYSRARSTVLPASVRGARPAVFGTWGRIGRRASLRLLSRHPGR